MHTSDGLSDDLLQPIEKEIHLLFHQARSLATEQLMLAVGGVVAEARLLCDVLNVLRVQHTSLTEGFGVGTNARSSSCGEAKFVER